MDGVPSATTFDHLRALRDWKPIRGCPGRLVMRSGTATLSIDELLGDGTVARRHPSQHARDEVWVAVFSDGGGVLSYRHTDGTWVHTLNTADGMQRKLRQLEIG